MSIFDWFKGKQKRSISYQTGIDAGFINPGVVSEESALTLSTVWRCARVVSDSVGTMPLKLYRITPEGREEDRDNPLWNILHDEPNDEMSSVDFYSLLQFWAVLWGNAYSEIQRDGAGNVVALWPIPPWNCQPKRSTAGTLVYQVGGELVLQASDVLHIKGPSADGTEGYRLLSIARNAFSFSLNLENFGVSYFGNKCNVGGTLKVPNELDDEGRENVRKSWLRMFSGAENTAKVAILDRGEEYTPIQISNEAGQYTETRQHQIYEICRYIGVDPIFAFEYGRATWNNAEAQTRNFLTFSLNPWLKRWESELSRKTIPIQNRKECYPEFVRESVIQMDAKTQSEVWKIGVEGGWYQPDEIRRWLNLSPLPKTQLDKENDGAA